MIKFTVNFLTLWHQVRILRCYYKHYINMHVNEGKSNPHLTSHIGFFHMESKQTKTLTHTCFVRCKYTIFTLRASATRRNTLGTSHREDHVEWLGRGRMKLHDVPRLLQHHLHSEPAPTMLIIHAGTNELGLCSTMQCRQAVHVNDALNSARELLPGSHITSSSILPRPFLL